MQPDHPKLTLDSLEEEADSPVNGLVHRYPDKALFLRECMRYTSRICSVTDRMPKLSLSVQPIAYFALAPTQLVLIRRVWQKPPSSPGVHDGRPSSNTSSAHQRSKILSSPGEIRINSCLNISR